MRLVTDIDANQTKRIFEVLAEDSDLFVDYTAQEVEQIASVFKLLTFRK